MICNEAKKKKLDCAFGFWHYTLYESFYVDTYKIIHVKLVIVTLVILLCNLIILYYIYKNKLHNKVTSINNILINMNNKVCIDFGIFLSIFI
jgi:hypothetical protein